MKIVEETPRLGIDQVRDCQDWSRFRAMGKVVLQIEADGGQHEVIAGLTTDSMDRPYLRCMQPQCRHPRCRYLHWVDGQLMCRACAGLLYEEQGWPDSKWREQVGRPALRAWRRLQRAA